MSGAVLFEHSHHGYLWRLQLASHNGRTFLNWRKWYLDGSIFKPTKEGCTIPLERLEELEAALASWRAENVTSKPGTGS